jgi:hypothetical protein
MTSRRTLIRALGFLIAACVLSPTFANAAAPKTKAEHIAIAEKYETKAAEQDAIVQEHTEMLKEYRANAARYPKQVREKRIAAMKKHCNAIIRDSKRLAADYRAMAHWHRVAAADLNEEE